MNQVQEMLRLTTEEKLEEGLLRLAGLFHVMAQQPGFLGAEVVRNINEPEVLVAFIGIANIRYRCV